MIEQIKLISILEVMTIVFPNKKADFNEELQEHFVVDGKKTSITNSEMKIISEKIKELDFKALADKKVQALENYIYANYASKKQAQDEKWVSSYTTKLKAAGVENLEFQIVQMVGSFFDGNALEEILKDTTEEQKYMFEKLLKVAIRTEWAERCIKEGLLAIEEDREPDYQQFPSL